MKELGHRHFLTTDSIWQSLKVTTSTVNELMSEGNTQVIIQF